MATIDIMNIKEEFKMNQRIRIACIAISTIVMSEFLQADTGPLMEPLKPTRIYNNHPGTSMYIEFNSGSMPGCYGNQGGVLYIDNNFYKEIYSQVLTLSTTGGVNGSVIYDINGPDGQWNKCTITGLHMFP